MAIAAGDSCTGIHCINAASTGLLRHFEATSTRPPGTNATSPKRSGPKAFPVSLRAGKRSGVARGRNPEKKLRKPVVQLSRLRQDPPGGAPTRWRSILAALAPALLAAAIAETRKNKARRPDHAREGGGRGPAGRGRRRHCRSLSFPENAGTDASRRRR